MVRPNAPPGNASRPRREHIDDEGFLQFGKYEGSHLVQVPESYLRWALSQTWIDDDFRAAIEARLDVDQDETFEEPADVPSRIAFPLIVFRHEEAVRGFLDGDPEPAVVGFARDKLRELCSEQTGKPFLPHGDGREGGAA